MLRILNAMGPVPCSRWHNHQNQYSAHSDRIESPLCRERPTMSKKMEPVYLLRLEIQLPAGYKPLARKFREDWDSIPLTEARRLGRQAKKSGWQLDACADRILKTGTGKTQQSATACALKLAMADIGACSNAVKIEYLQIKQYPWFFLSTVAIYPQALRKDANVAAIP